MNASTTKVPQWEWDYALTPVYDQYLFAEYLDIGSFLAFTYTQFSIEI